MKILHNNSYITLNYYEENFLHIDWEGYLNVDQVKEGCGLIMEVIATKQCFLAVNDNRKVKGTWTQAIKWLEHDYLPQVVQLGIQKIAFLYSPDQSARYSVDRLLEVNDQYEGQTFDDFEEATNWLLGKTITEKEVPQIILLKTLEGYSKIILQEIYYISRHAGQTIIQTTHQQYITRKSLTQVLALLPGQIFFRIHKSHIVNVEKIKSLKYYEGGYYHLFLHDLGNIYLTVGRNYIKDLKLLLKK